MRSWKIIGLIITIFSAGRLCSQVGKDTLWLRTDSVALLPSDTSYKTNSDLVKLQFRRSVVYIVKTNFGVVFTGYVTNETEHYITIDDRITRERFYIKKSDIYSAKVFSTRQTSFSPYGENYHAGQYMFASSAFLFQKESLASTYHWFLLENLDYCITENWAVSVSSIAFYPVSLGVKCAFQIDENNYIGGGIFGIGNITARDGNFFLGYSGIIKFTRGTSNQNFTVAGGVLGINSDLVYSATSPLPFYNLYFSSLAYCSRLNEHIALNLEGWYFPQAQIGLAGAGIKLVKNQDCCWTFGLYSALNLLDNAVKINYKALPIPYLGMSQKF